MAVQLHDIPMRSTLPERFERKYYLRPEKVNLGYGLLRQSCLMDTEYPSEQINSLYFDTPDLEQHERSDSGDFKKDKVRIRWYGDEERHNGKRTIFIELKSRHGFAGTKQRLRFQVPSENLFPERLGNGIIPRTMLTETLARFGCFLLQPLQPIIKISYWRYRFNEIMTGQRVSLDCNIRSTMIMQCHGNGEKELELPGGVIEIKGRTMEMPVTLKRASLLDTDWTRLSKYSASIDSHTESPGVIGRLSPSGRLIYL